LSENVPCEIRNYPLVLRHLLYNYKHMKIQQTVYSALWIVFMAVGCQEDNAPLPAPTQDGRGTLACRIDGEVWKPYSNDFKKSSTGARFLKQYRTLYIGGGNDEKENGIVIGLKDFDGNTGTYELNSICNSTPVSDANCGAFVDARYLSMGNSYWTNSTYKGFVKIDKCSGGSNGGIVSGTFEFQAQHPQTGKIVKVTDGRFDLTYITYY
jgi:hypothetical protein